jgi:WD40-like Beta Propeller Repeat
VRRLIVVVWLAACGRLNFDPVRSVADDAPGDGAPACATFGGFGAQDHLTALATAGNDLAPALHPDGLTLVFDTDVTGSRVLHLTKRMSPRGPFATSTVIAELTNADDNMQAAWSADGKRLHWHRLGTANDQMVADYDGSTFTNPRIDDLPANSDNHSLSLDELEVFFTQYPGGIANLGHARRTAVGAAWVVDTEVDALNTGGEQGYPSLDESRQTLYFERPALGTTSTEIAAATRSGPRAPFGNAVTVAELSIGNGKNGDPEVSRDGTTMIFASDRPGTQNADLFETQRPCRD